MKRKIILAFVCPWGYNLSRLEKNGGDPSAASQPQDKFGHIAYVPSFHKLWPHLKGGVKKGA